MKPNWKDLENFDSITLTVASPEVVKSWSHGEVMKPETINYRTQKPELDGLFCERIFGPTRNWECYCGKYKRIRYKGIVCEKCGVEVTRSVVRRERMGNISLAVPVTHIWFLRSMPSRLGLILDLPVRLLEQITYFASYIVVEIDEKAREESLENLDKDFKEYKKKIIEENKKSINEIRAKMYNKGKEISKNDRKNIEKIIKNLKEVPENFSDFFNFCSDLPEIQKIFLNSLSKADKKKSRELAEKEILKFLKNWQETKFLTKRSMQQIKKTFKEKQKVIIDIAKNLEKFEIKIGKKERELCEKSFFSMINLMKVRGFLPEKKEVLEKKLEELEKSGALRIEELTEAHQKAYKELKNLNKNTVLTELEYRELNMKFGHVFSAGTGAESIRKLLEEIDLDEFLKKLQKKKEESTGQKQKKITKRIRFISSLKRAGIRPEWMILTVLPIIPPELRPMVQLDGGRFAASDLNDLYRRIINRNNRLKRLKSIGAPEVICRNEKRMLQEAVDTLINNSPRTGRSVFTSGDRRKLRSLSDMLKGKQGRFRQNLLGKRVDYSGRSVIVVGPQLKLHQCGLPKEMAMKLFKPFVIGELIRKEYAYNVKSAEKYILSGEKVVWDILQEVIKGKYVLLNRAPTLHRLGIQAFEPTLIDGKAIQIHPLVCAAFNADFDGDQMAVHLPLSDEAQKEAREIICSRRNLLKPSAGKPVITPTQDMVLGCYFLTQVHDGKKGEGMVFADFNDAISAEQNGIVDLQAKIFVRNNGEILETSVGRIIFNEILPPEVGFKNCVFRKKDLEELISEIFEVLEMEKTAEIVDDIKKLGFYFATKSGISIGHADMIIPDKKEEIIQDADEKVRIISNQYWKGFITENERYINALKIWSQAKNDVAKSMISEFKKFSENDIFYMIDSGARGNWGQITQMCGMKGLVANPGGKTIELPIKSNLKEGFLILEYFIATHGGRKGKSDTALKTAEAGYLTRRLVDAVQDIVIRELDCEQEVSHEITREESEKIGEAFENRIFGRTLAEDLIDQNAKEKLASKNDFLDKNLIREVKTRQISSVKVRSIMTCKTKNGICQKCYGFDLGNNKPVKIGTPVGIIAAQSIGEPGTQLTMRTFHMGGVAEGSDITQGLTRVEELLETRAPKTPAVLADISGKIKIENFDNTIRVSIKAVKPGEDIYSTVGDINIVVKDGDQVKENQILAKGNQIIRAKYAGTVTEIKDQHIIVKHSEAAYKVYEFSTGVSLIVDNNSMIEAGEPITGGHFNLQELMQHKDEYAVQKYLMSEVQTIYASQGQTINDKHIEIIVKQMFSKVRIIDPGDMKNVLPGEVLNYQRVSMINKKLREKNKKEVVFERLLLGLSRISLTTESWLSAASFQETIRVLVEAATTGKVDYLEGLKENVIIGKLIPAGKIYRNSV